VDRNGNILEEYKPPSSPIFGKRVLPSDVTWIISNILADNNARLIDFGPDSALVIPGQYVPVKTGTTNDFRDNWTIGYTPSYLVAVWVGNNDHSPMSSIASGITGAAPIWHDIMVYLLKNKKQDIPQKPPDIYQKYVCDTTGLLPTSTGSCPTHLEYLIEGTETRSPNIYQDKEWIDKTTNALAQPGQTTNVTQQEETMMTDVMGNKYCLTCAHPAPTPTPHP
jgi:membrane peptidoglycan carboxypeptidase